MPTFTIQSSRQFNNSDDPEVKNFPTDKPLIVFDGVCILCNSVIKFILDRDKDKKFNFTTAQSDLGQALFSHYNLDTSQFETILLVKDGQAYGKLEAVVEIMKDIGGLWSATRVLLIFPRPVRDWLYDRIARNRYRLFGRTESCMIPPPSWKDRFIE